jgi:hypothetical protein
VLLVAGALRGLALPWGSTALALPATYCSSGYDAIAGSGQYGATAGSSVVLAPMRVAAVLPLRAAGRCVAAAARPKTGMLP